MTDIETYNAQSAYSEICNKLCIEISEQLPNATSKIWHGSPVWFLNENPIVGYAARKNGVQLLFWSGQSFEESVLQPEGSFKAAEKYYEEAAEISLPDLQRWLEKAARIQWDYKNIVKQKGVLERL